MSDELLDAALRNLFIFLWLCSFLPASLFASGVPNLNMGSGMEKMEIEIRAFRLQQFETAGKMYGSKSWKVGKIFKIKSEKLKKMQIKKKLRKF